MGIAMQQYPLTEARIDMVHGQLNRKAAPHSSGSCFPASFSPLVPVGLAAQSYLQSPRSLAILALAALLRPVSPHVLALSLAISIGDVLEIALHGAPSIQPMLCPAVLQGSWGPLRFYPHFQARSLVLALVALSSRSFDRWYLTHWRSFAALSAGPSAGGTSRPSAPPGAFDRADDIPALWQMIVRFPFNLGHLHIQASSVGCCSGGALLALLRPVVPYTLALSVALSVGDVSASAALRRSSSPTGFLPSCPTGGLFVFEALVSFYSRSPKLQKHRNILTVALWVQTPSIDPSLVQWKVSGKDGFHTGELVLCWGSVEQTWREYMPPYMLIVSWQPTSWAYTKDARYQSSSHLT